MRPLRLAFVVEPHDRGAVLKAIQTASFLWGGSYCPIVPYYRHLPRGWSWHGRGAGSSARAVVEGYLEAFDPDLVVLVGKL